MALPLLDPLTAPTVARTRLDALLSHHSLSLSTLLPIIASRACYHSSIVLGWLDGHSLNVAFPEPSLRGQNLVNIVPQKMRVRAFTEALDKYSTRGYRLVTVNKGNSISSIKVKKEGTVQGKAFGDQRQSLTEEELKDITKRMGWSVEIPPSH